MGTNWGYQRPQKGTVLGLALGEHDALHRPGDPLEARIEDDAVSKGGGLPPSGAYMPKQERYKPKPQ